MADAPSQQELEAGHCWEADDRVPGRPGMTAFRRRTRLHQARWREANGHPIGTQPVNPPADGRGARLVGSRLPLDYARATGANFVTTAARQAATARLSAAAKEEHQSLSAQRLWADLLSSEALSFNLFADQRGWPDAPGAVSEVRFQHSPGRLDSAYTANLVDWDAAFLLDLGDGTHGIVAVNTVYHEKIRRYEPKPERLPRYLEVTERSGLFKPEAIDAVNGTDLLLLWLEHLLLLSMLQHPSGAWRWGRYVVVHPAGNTDYADACERYRSLLVDDSTFASMTVEELVDSKEAAVRDRYL